MVAPERICQRALPPTQPSPTPPYLAAVDGTPFFGVGSTEDPTKHNKVTYCVQKVNSVRVWATCRP